MTAKYAETRPCPSESAPSMPSLLTKVLSHFADSLVLTKYQIQALVELVDDPQPEHCPLRIGHSRHSLSQRFTIDPELTSDV